MLLKVETNNKNNLYDYEENKVYISCKEQKGEDNRREKETSNINFGLEVS